MGWILYVNIVKIDAFTPIFIVSRKSLTIVQINVPTFALTVRVLFTALDPAHELENTSAL